MPTAGLSLVGFIDKQDQAIHHLRTTCIPADPTDAALVKEWSGAKAKLGPAAANAGAPDIKPIAPPSDAYIQQLRGQKWFQTAVKIFGLQAADFKLIEIAPLLAYQFHVDIERSGSLCNALTNPTILDLMPVCLPQTQQKVADLKPLGDPQGQSITIKARNLNMRKMNVGLHGYVLDGPGGYETIVAGMQIHVTLPFVHVVRFNGRCYLHNGYHRALGVARAGATHIPCLFRDATKPDDAGIKPETDPLWSTFPLRILESANPPTIGHFVRGDAYDVQIRSISRLLHITWTESAMPDEYERMTP
jgi:hypothetical protein